MIRQIKIARDTARKGRTAAIVTFKALMVTIPAELREQFEGLHRQGAHRPLRQSSAGGGRAPTASAKHALRSLARRYQLLDAEIAAHDAILDELTPSAVTDAARRVRHWCRHRRRGPDRVR